MMDVPALRVPAANPAAGKRILLVGGAFSGITSSVAAALRARGCEVIELRRSLRHSRLRPLYLLLMAAHALLLYRTQFRRYLHRTPTANWARRRATEAALARCPPVDAVLAMQVESSCWHPHKRPGVRYALLTDHVNLLSKQLPDYGFEIPEKRVSAAWNRTERAILSGQDYVFVMGAYVGECIAAQYGIPRERITVVRAGPNQDLDAGRDGVHKDFRQRNVLFVGLDAERKGLPMLAQAFARVREEFPDACLHVAGVEGESGAGIHYHGRVGGQRLKDLFYSAQVFVLPSYREPYGVAVVEGMWAKTACIGTRTGAMPEVIEHGASGYLIDPGDTDALGRHLIELFRDPALMERMAERGYLLARQGYGWDHVAAQITEALFGNVNAVGQAAEVASVTVAEARG